MNYIKACSLGLLGGLSLALSVQRASATTLADAEAPGFTIVEGDKTFSNFTYTSSSALLDASKVSVSQVASGFGLVFTAGWNTTTDPALDAVIGYTVTVNPASGMAISGAGLDIKGLVSVGGASVSVGETLTGAGSPVSLNAFWDNGSSGTPNNVTDSKAITPSATSLNVVKDITLAKAPNTPSYAAVSWVDNTFTQTPGGGNPPPIPEPASLALIPLAIAGLGLRKKFAH